MPFRISKQLSNFARRNRDIFIGLSADLAGIPAGFTISFLIPYFDLVPWILLVVPFLLTVRGAINGAFSGRLTTGLNIGTIYPRFRKNTEEYYTLSAAIFLLSVINGLVATLFIGIYHSSKDPVEWLATLIVVLNLFFLTAYLANVLTSFVGFMSFKRGINPDAVVYPIMSTVNDVLGSLIFFTAIVVLEPWNPMSTITRGTPILIICASVVLYFFIKNRGKRSFRRTVIEVYPGVLFSLVTSSVTGVVLSLLEESIVEHPGILIVLPAMMDTVGDVGSIHVSLTTTRLHLGIMEPKTGGFLRVISHVPEYAVPFTLLVVIYSTFGAVLSGILADIILLMLVYIIVEFLGIIIMLYLAHGIAVMTFKFGVNPDNVSIPILTATADLMTASTVYTIVTLL